MSEVAVGRGIREGRGGSFVNAQDWHTKTGEWGEGVH